MTRQATVAFITLLLAVCSGAPGQDKKAVLRVTADAGVSSVEGKQRQSNGRGPTSTLRQNQNWSRFESKNLLLAFDSKKVEGWTVSKAYLSIYLAKSRLYGAGLCTILAPWQEGGATNWTETPGAPCWDFVRTPQRHAKPTAENYWAGEGSGVYSVTWAHPAARYSHAGPGTLRYIKKSGQRFAELQIPVDPALVESLSAGVAYGLALTDDKGQIAEAMSLIGPGKPYRSNEAEDIWVFTRDIQDENLRPTLVVWGQKIDKTPPGQPAGLKVEQIDAAGVARLSFVAPGDDGRRGDLLAYDAVYSSKPMTEAIWNQAQVLPRWSIPKPVGAGTKQVLPVFTLAPGNYYVGVRGVDEAGNRGPAAFTELIIPEPPTGLIAPPAKAAAGGAETKSLPGKAGVLDVFACGSDAKIDPVTGQVLLQGTSYRRDTSFAYTNDVWSSGSATISLTAAANEVVAFQTVIKKLGASLRGVEVKVSGLTSAGPGRAKIEALKNFENFRIWYINATGQSTPAVGPGELDDKTLRPTGWHGEICMPIKAPFPTTFDIPAKDNKVPSQNFQSVWTDLYIPRGTKPGLYKGTVTVTAAGLARPIVLSLEITVLPLSLPDKNTWVVELNRYNPIGGWAGGKGLENQILAERSYYSLAHKHRLTVNVVCHSHSGRISKEYAPVLGGKGASTHIADWSAFDRRWGPLFDGSLFTPDAGYVGPGQGVPISHIYTTFHENWPMPLVPNYKFYKDVSTRLEFADYAKQAGRFEAGLSDEYKKGFVNVTSEYFKHFKAKGWTNTALQFYYNNKYYWKVGFFGGMGRGGVSFWLWDEPTDFDDYDANGYLLELALEGYRKAETPEVTIHTRTDVSQAEMSRGLWDDKCNLWNASMLLRYYAPTARMRMKFLPGEEYWKYGGGAGPTAPAADFLARAMGTWMVDTTGYLPYWNTFGDRNWTGANPLSLFRRGMDCPSVPDTYLGAVASVRLKYLRRSQQDMEYLHLLAGREGWSRQRVRLALTAYADDPKAAIPSFDKLSATQWRQVRQAVVNTILK